MRILITGASGGIGRAIASRLHTEGAELVLHSHTHTDVLREFTSSWNPSSFRLLSADLRSCEGRSVLTEELLTGKPLDGAVFCHGTSMEKLLQDMTDDEIQELILTNLSSTILLTRSLIPIFLKSENSSLLYISSIWGDIGGSFETVYSATKGGINAFVRALSKELGPSGIRVNAISPGWIETEMTAHFTEEDRALFSEKLSLGRTGRPGEIASLARYLLMENTYMTGQILRLDGGYEA